MQRTADQTKDTRPPLGGRWARAGDTREAFVLTLVLAGAVAVAWVWFTGIHTGSLHTLSDRLTGAGRVTGLVGTYLVLIQVLLMARVPWLERFIGGDRLSAWHRKNGAYAIALLVAHALFTIWGYALADRIGVVGETGRVIGSYPDMLAATVGLVLLVVVGFLSARQARRRLRYETWYLIHLYTYIAIALSFSHQLATGADFVTNIENRVLWVAMYAFTFGMLIAYRLVSPVRAFFRHDLRVDSVIAEGRNAVSVHITGHDLGALGAKAGQFFRWRFLGPGTWWQSHPFSLSASPNGRYLRITAKRGSDHADELALLRPGTRVVAEGPFGAMTADRRIRPKVLMIAGGIGITPLFALIEEIDGEPGDVTLLYRARFERDLILREDIETLAHERGIEVFYLLGQRAKNSDALGPARLHGLVPDVAQRDVYLCGPPGFMDEAMKSLRRLKVRRSQIHRERFEF